MQDIRSCVVLQEFDKRIAQFQTFSDGKYWTPTYRDGVWDCSFLEAKDYTFLIQILGLIIGKKNVFFHSEEFHVRFHSCIEALRKCIKIVKRTIAWGSEVFECFESNYIQFANLANELFPSFIRDEKVKVSNTESLSTKGGKRTKRKRQTETADIPIQPLTFPKFISPLILSTLWSSMAGRVIGMLNIGKGFIKSVLRPYVTERIKPKPM